LKTFVLSACLLTASVQAVAAASDIVAADNQFALSYFSTNVDYTETGAAGPIDTETGPVPGFGVAISSFGGPGGLYAHAAFDRATGHTTYTGAFIQGGPFGSVVSTSTATLMDFSGRLGKGFALGDRAMLIPYGEVGRHQWDRGVNYGETYSHFYFAAGALAQYSPAARVVLSADAMLGRTAGSYITVNGGPGLTGFSGALGDSVISRIGLSGDFAFTRAIHGGIAVDYTSFKYGKSAMYPGTVNGVSALLYEPDSTTHYTTIKLSIGVAL